MLTFLQKFPVIVLYIILNFLWTENCIIDLILIKFIQKTPYFSRIFIFLKKFLNKILIFDIDHLGVILYIIV